jgi:hypothetical protein
VNSETLKLEFLRRVISQLEKAQSPLFSPNKSLMSCKALNFRRNAKTLSLVRWLENEAVDLEVSIPPLLKEALAFMS